MTGTCARAAFPGSAVGENGTRDLLISSRRHRAANSQVPVREMIQTFPVDVKLSRTGAERYDQKRCCMPSTVWGCCSYGKLQPARPHRRLLVWFRPVQVAKASHVLSSIVTRAPQPFQDVFSLTAVAPYAAHKTHALKHILFPSFACLYSRSVQKCRRANRCAAGAKLMHFLHRIYGDYSNLLTIFLRD